MKKSLIRAACLASSFCLRPSAFAEATNSPAPSAGFPLPDAGLSLVRVLGALALVLAIFLGCVWLFRNWQRLALQRGRAPKLNVLEVRSLGGRHALYVVAYEQERFLLAASPAGVNLVSHLQPGGDSPPAASPAPGTSFAQALRQKLQGK